MSGPRIICTTKIDEMLLEPLVGCELIMPGEGSGVTLSRSAVLEAAGNSIAIINQSELRVDAEVLASAPDLKLIANISRGFDNLDLPAMTRHGVWGSNVPDAFTAPTAEVAMGLLLMVTRKLAEGAAFVRAGEWKAFEPGRWDGQLLEGKTMGMIGFGKIGQAVADRAIAFGLDIIYSQRSAVDYPRARRVSLEELLAISDIVSLHMPATTETRHLINDQTLAQMKPGSILINTARGIVVEETALIRALESNHLGGAGLDVAEFEPQVSERLRSRSNVVITPHLGGGTRESRLAARQHAIANVADLLAGKRPRSALNEIN